MANLTGQELIDRLYDIGLANTRSSEVVNDGQFFPNHVLAPAVPYFLDRVLSTNATSLILGVNELKESGDSLDRTVNAKINTQFAVLGDYLTFPSKKNQLFELDVDVLEALYQLHLRLTTMEPDAPVVHFGNSHPLLEDVKIDTPKIKLEITPEIGEFTISNLELIKVIKVSDLSELDTTVAIVDYTFLEISIHEIMEAGETYSIIVDKKALKNGGVFNLIEYSQTFTLPASEVIPTFDDLSITPGSVEVNYLSTDKITIPINSSSHLNLLAIDETKISVEENSNSVLSLEKSPEIINSELIIYLQAPLLSTTTYDLLLQEGAVFDGSSLSAELTYSFTTEALSTLPDPDFSLKSFSMLSGLRTITEEELEAGLDLSEVLTQEMIYGLESRKVFLFKVRETGLDLDLSLMKLSTEFDSELDSNDWGSYYDINLETGELLFFHDMIEAGYDFNLVIFTEDTTIDDAIAWASANIV